MKTLPALMRARLAAGLSRRRLSTRAGVHKNTLYRLEKETQQPTLAQARRLASALGATVDQLFPSKGKVTE